MPQKRSTLACILVIICALCFVFAACAEANSTLTISALDTVVYVKSKLPLIANVPGVRASETPMLIWKSSNPAIAKVDTKGNVLGVAPGTATIRVCLQENEAVAATLDIEVRMHASAVSLDAKSITLLLGADDALTTRAMQCTVTPQNAYDQTVTWSSSDETVATVDAFGRVTAVGEGKAMLYATANDTAVKKPAACEVVVGQAVTSVTLSEHAVSIPIKKKHTLKPKVLPKNAVNTDLEWMTSDATVATVDARGVVKAKGIGQATITVLAADGSGVQDACEITVVRPVTKLTGKDKKLTLFANETTALEVSILPADASDQTLNWQSSNAMVASVDGSGMVTAKSKGKATITAIANDGSGKSCKCDVVVEPSRPISLTGLGRGNRSINLMEFHVHNNCQRTTIINFDFDIVFETGNGIVSNSGSYSIGMNVSVGPGHDKTISRTIAGAGYATKLTITITGVLFEGGRYYKIPSAEQETWTFSY